MKNFLIRVGVVVALTGAAALPAHAEHQDLDIALQIGLAIAQYNDGYQRHDRRNYRYDRYGREIRHARNHQRKHRSQHGRNVVKHGRWHWRNDGRWDGYYNNDHADFHHDQRHGHRRIARTKVLF